MRVAEFDDLFTASLRDIEQQSPSRARLNLDGGADLRTRVQDLVDREAACCSFFTFDVKDRTSHNAPGATVTLDIRVPADRSDVLAGLVERAQAQTREWRS